MWIFDVILFGEGPGEGAGIWPIEGSSSKRRLFSLLIVFVFVFVFVFGCGEGESQLMC